MGCRKDLELTNKKRKSGGVTDDSGLLSIDFLAGISIFVITLIIAATMISGLLIGLQSKKIDFDAVAYRTGVILVEDPGEPNTQFYYSTINESQQWEFVGFDQKDQVRRFGLTLYKSTPRVLAEQKIIRFFDRTQFPELSEYNERLIGGDYPYHFNVTFKIIGGDSYSVGEPIDSNSPYGYIRRIVLVKNETRAEVDMSQFYSLDPDSYRFNVNLTYGWLYNQSRGPQYWIEPPKENITINLINIEEIRNKDQPLDVGLKNITMYFDGILLNGTPVYNIPLPFDIIAEIDGETPPMAFLFQNNGTTPSGIPKDVTKSINITFPAGYFIPPSTYANITLIKMNVKYGFSPGTVNLSSNYNSYEYIPDSPNSLGFSAPDLRPAIMEVRIW